MSRVRVVAALAAVVALMIGTTGARAAAAPLPADTEAEILVVQEHLTPVADVLDGAGRDDPQFTAVEVDVPTGKAIVYRQGGAAAGGAIRYRTATNGTLGTQNSALPDGLPPLTLEVRSAVLTAAQNASLEQRLLADVDGLVASGIPVVSFGAGPAGGAYRIGVTDAARHRAALLARYGGFGAGTVTVAEAEAGGNDANRFKDTSPFYGGSRIRAWDAKPHGNCTSGFGVKSYPNQIEYLLVAAHCVDGGDRRFWTPDVSAGGSGVYIGAVTSFNPGLDAAFIRTATNPFIFDGGLTNAFTKRVAGQRGYVRGEYICVSGSYTGVRCEGVQDAQDYRRVCQDNGQCAQVPVVVARHARGAALVQPGDSGAPVFIPRSDHQTVLARGIHQGSPTFNLVTCPDGRRVCRAIMWFVDITRITATHRVSVSTL